MAVGAIDAGALASGCLVALWLLHIGGQTSAASAKMQEDDVQVPIITQKPAFATSLDSLRNHDFVNNTRVVDWCLLEG
jgi:hypothetical protein